MDLSYGSAANVTFSYLVWRFTLRRPDGCRGDVSKSDPLGRGP